MSKSKFYLVPVFRVQVPIIWILSIAELWWIWWNVFMTSTMQTIRQWARQCCKNITALQQTKAQKLVAVTICSHIHYSPTINEPEHDKTNKITYVPNKDSDQPGRISLHSHAVWSVFAVRSKDSPGTKASSYRQQRLRSDWVNAQPDLSLRWAHRSFCWFCRATVHFIQCITSAIIIL